MLKCSFPHSGPVHIPDKDLMSLANDSGTLASFQHALRDSGNEIEVGKIMEGLTTMQLSENMANGRPSLEETAPAETQTTVCHR